MASFTNACASSTFVHPPPPANTHTHIQVLSASVWERERELENEMDQGMHSCRYIWSERGSEESTESLTDTEIDMYRAEAYTPSRRRLRLRGAYQPPSIISMRISIFHPVFPKFMQTSKPSTTTLSHHSPLLVLSLGLHFYCAYPAIYVCTSSAPFI